MCAELYGSREVAGQMQTKDVSEVIESLLRERFDDVAFESVSVERDTDEFGDDILRVRVVFDSVLKVLDPRKTSGLLRHLRPRIAELGEDAFPVMFYIAKSELGKVKSEAR